MTFLIYLGLGAFAGTLAGLLGVGGGLVIVPVLVMIFTAQQMPASIIMHLAVGTSLATIVFTSLSSVYAHHRRAAVRWDLVRQLSPGIILGAFIGALLAEQISREMLQRGFALFEWLVALQMWLSLRAEAERALPGHLAMGATGSGIGLVSSLMGIGGGTLTVPFLSGHGVVMREAVATSAACGLPIAVAGAFGFVVSGWGDVRLPMSTSGYLYWPAWLGIVIASVLFAPLGSWLAHHLPGKALKRFFAIFLALLGLRMWLMG